MMETVKLLKPWDVVAVHKDQPGSKLGYDSWLILNGSKNRDGKHEYISLHRKFSEAWLALRKEQGSINGGDPIPQCEVDYVCGLEIAYLAPPLI